MKPFRNRLHGYVFYSTIGLIPNLVLIPAYFCIRGCPGGWRIESMSVIYLLLLYCAWRSKPIIQEYQECPGAFGWLQVWLLAPILTVAAYEFWP